MSDHDPEKFRLALRQMALDAALDLHEDAPAQDFEPLAPGVEDRLVQIACQSVAGSPKAPSPAPTPTPTPSGAAAVPLVAPALSVTRTGRRRSFGRLRSRPLWAATSIMAAVAAAAAAAIVLSGHPPAPGGPVYVAVTPTTVQLPGQDGKLMLGAGSTTGVPVSRLRLSRRQTLSLVLSPQKGGGEAEQVYTFIRHQNQPPRRWGVEPQKSDHGAFVLNIPLREAPAVESEQDLLFVLGPAGISVDPLQLDKPKRPSAYSLITVHLVVTD